MSQILAEWSRRGRTTIVNGERVPGPPVTLELQNVSEQQALDIVLRGVSGYLVAARETAISGASVVRSHLHSPNQLAADHRRAASACATGACRCRTIRMTTRRRPTVLVGRTRRRVRGCRAT